MILRETLGEVSKIIPKLGVKRLFHSMSNLHPIFKQVFPFFPILCRNIFIQGISTLHQQNTNMTFGKLQFEDQLPFHPHGWLTIQNSLLLGKIVRNVSHFFE